MIKKISTSVLIFLFALCASGQQTVIINGRDSVKFSLSIDTAARNLLLEIQQLKINAKAETSRFKLKGLTNMQFNSRSDSANFYAKINQSLTNNNTRSQVHDSIKKYLLKNGILNIIVKSDGFLLSAVPKPQLPPPRTLPNYDEDSLGMIPMILIFIAACVIMLIVVYIVFKKRIPGNNDKEDTDIVIPRALLELFSINTQRTKEPSDQLQLIMAGYHDLVRGKQEMQQLYSSSVNETLQLRNELTKSKEESGVLTERLKLTEEQIKTKEADGSNFETLAKHLLDIYFTPVGIKLSANELKDDKRIYQFILENIFHFAFHSASLLKKQTHNASHFDKINLELLKGEDPSPNGIIDDNSQHSQSDPLAYHIYQLLKLYDSKKLDRVFINGYKIGK